MPKPSINEINMAMGMANLLAGLLAKRLPIPALITSKLSFAMQSGVTTVSINEGTGTTNIPYTIATDWLTIYGRGYDLS